MPPWETAGYGVVSLLDMLDFSASDYIEIAHEFGLILGDLKKKKSDPQRIGTLLSRLSEQVVHLGLSVTREHLGQLILDVVKENPHEAKLTAEGLITIKTGLLNTDRLCYHFEALYSTLQAELRSILFKAIPKEKNRFCSPKWLTDTIVFEKFPDTVDEFQKAGRCFAYGENTACVFHLMRVTDFLLRKVADSLPVSYDARNWDGIGKKITAEMEKKYQTKTDDWKKNEPFYAEILTDIQAISRAHRNPALHELEKKYDEREASYLLTVIEAFARHVAGKL